MGPNFISHDFAKSCLNGGEHQRVRLRWFMIVDVVVHAPGVKRCVGGKYMSREREIVCIDHMQWRWLCIDPSVLASDLNSSARESVFSMIGDGWVIIPVISERYFRRSLRGVRPS